MSKAAEIEELTVSIGGVRTFLRRRRGDGEPVLLVHGNPTHSADWLPFLEQIEGPAIALDLPGFGRSERPPTDRLEPSMHGYAAFLERALEELGIGDYGLAVHDWGAVALLTAQRHPERLRRLVVIDAVPLLPGYRWHWIARIWRRRIAGELFIRLNSKAGTALLLRQARPGRRPMPREFVEMVWEGWDAGMSRAVLGLYRSADPEALEAAGARLHLLECPALVVWGSEDPYLGPEWGRRYAERLPRAELLELERAGHWPWIDRPELVDRVVEFLA